MNGEVGFGVMAYGGRERKTEGKGTVSFIVKLGMSQRGVRVPTVLRLM